MNLTRTAFLAVWRGRISRPNLSSSHMRSQLREDVTVSLLDWLLRHMSEGRSARFALFPFRCFHMRNIAAFHTGSEEQKDKSRVARGTVGVK